MGDNTTNDTPAAGVTTPVVDPTAPPVADTNAPVGGDSTMGTPTPSVTPGDAGVTTPVVDPTADPTASVAPTATPPATPVVGNESGGADTGNSGAM